MLYSTNYSCDAVEYITFHLHELYGALWFSVAAYLFMALFALRESPTYTINKWNIQEQIAAEHSHTDDWMARLLVVCDGRNRAVRYSFRCTVLLWGPYLLLAICSIVTTPHFSDSRCFDRAANVIFLAHQAWDHTGAFLTANNTLIPSYEHQEYLLLWLRDLAWSVSFFCWSCALLKVVDNQSNSFYERSSLRLQTFYLFIRYWDGPNIVHPTQTNIQTITSS